MVLSDEFTLAVIQSFGDLMPYCLLIRIKAKIMQNLESKNFCLFYNYNEIIEAWYIINTLWVTMLYENTSRFLLVWIFFLKAWMRFKKISKLSSFMNKLNTKKEENLREVHKRIFELFRSLLLYSPPWRHTKTASLIAEVFPPFSHFLQTESFDTVSSEPWRMHTSNYFAHATTTFFVFLPCIRHNSNGNHAKTKHPAKWRIGWRNLYIFSYKKTIIRLIFNGKEKKQKFLQ